MNQSCLECGALALGELGCREQLGLLIAWEAGDPTLGALHYRLVASYNLQHPAQFTSAALAGLYRLFVDHLDHGLAISEIRRRTGAAFAGGTRVLRPEAERPPIVRAWSLTIADVYLPDQPVGAAERVRRWAAAVRQESPAY